MSLMQAITTPCASWTLLDTGTVSPQSPLTGGHQRLLPSLPHTVFCLHWLSELTNHLLPLLPVDLALYKQHRSIGKVNYPWLVTNNKIITL